MPPVPLHIDDPITPQKAQDLAPQAATTQPNAPPPSHPAARPGAAAPAPTPYTPNARYQPQPSRTEAGASHDGPPPPQPGAVPVPLSQQAPITTANTVPPPPEAGEAAAQRSASITTMPPQITMPAPQQNYAITHSTMPHGTAPTPANAGPTTLDFGAAPAPAPAPAFHQPGYQQNTHAQEMSSAVRASIDDQERKASLAPALGLGGDSTNETAANVWNTVKGWGNKAGETLIEADKKFWETVNKKS